MFLLNVSASMAFGPSERYFPIRQVLVQNFDMGHSSHSALIIEKSKFMSENTYLDIECQAISPDIPSNTIQVIFPILVK